MMMIFVRSSAAVICAAFLCLTGELIQIEGRVIAGEESQLVFGGVQCNGKKSSQACGTGTQSCDTSTECDNVGERCAGTSVESTSGSIQECIDGDSDNYCKPTETQDTCTKKVVCQCKNRIGQDKCGKVNASGQMTGTTVNSTTSCTMPGG